MRWASCAQKTISATAGVFPYFFGDFSDKVQSQKLDSKVPKIRRLGDALTPPEAYGAVIT
jgi:hypothetical protein